MVFRRSWNEKDKENEFLSFNTLLNRQTIGTCSNQCTVALSRLIKQSTVGPKSKKFLKCQGFLLNLGLIKENIK